MVVYAVKRGMFPHSGEAAKQEHAPFYHQGVHIGLDAHYGRYVEGL